MTAYRIKYIRDMFSATHPVPGVVLVIAKSVEKAISTFHKKSTDVARDVPDPITSIERFELDIILPDREEL